MDDLISRQAAINSQIKMIAQGLDWIPVFHLEQLPSAERRGRWIYNANFAEPPFKCSACGKSQGRLSTYCPDCGAEMEVE